MIPFSSILKSAITGDFEIGRVALAVGVVATVTTPIMFEFLDMYHNGWHFDPAVWCVVYPGGLLALSGGGLFFIGNKEKQVATAQQTAVVTAGATA